ncbi:hypothetical protein D3C87_2169020 [compost metagenome]
MQPDRTHQLVIDIDAEAVAIVRIVIGVAGHLLGIDGNELFPPIGLVAQPVHRIELFFG